MKNRTLILILVLVYVFFPSTILSASSSAELLTVNPQSSCKPANSPQPDGSCSYIPVVDKNNCVVDYQKVCPPPPPEADGGPTPTPLPTEAPAPKPSIFEIIWNWLNSLFN